MEAQEDLSNEVVYDYVAIQGKSKYEQKETNQVLVIPAWPLQSIGSRQTRTKEEA